MKNLLYSLVFFLWITPQYIQAQQFGKDPFFDSLYVAAHTLHDSDKVNSFCNISGMVLDENLDLSRKWLDTAHMFFAKYQTPFTEMKLNITEADYAFKIGHLEQAYQYLKKALSSAEKLGKYEYASDLCTQVGDILMELERYPEAETYYLESLKRTQWIETNFQKLPQAKRQFTDIYALYNMAYLRLAKCYEQMPSKSLEEESALQKAKQHAYNLDYPVIIGNTYTYLLEHYISHKQVDKAAEAFSKADSCYQILTKDANNQIDWRTDLFFFKGLLAKLQGHNSLALTLINQSLDNFKKSGDVKRIGEVYKALSELHETMGNWQQAYAMQKQYISYNDSLQSKSQFTIINNLEAKYQNEQKQTQIEQQASELSQRQRVEWGLLAGLTVFGLLSFLLFRQNKKVNKANDKIQRQATQLQTMMRELHHRTKNNMQVVSSLLNLQTARLTESSEAADAMRSGQARVEAMSLIHQRLYQSSDVSIVNMEAFVKDLIEKLTFAFGQTPVLFTSKITIDKPELNVDTAMPLGLIINELLTNSFKHAFSKSSHAVLTITFQEQEGHWHLHYADNGEGLPPQYDMAKSNSFGMQLIVSLVQQLQGTYQYWNEQGFHFELSIPR